jgi:hypothetical protein
MAPVCPSGFDWMDQSGCVAFVTTAAAKEAATAQCQSINPKAKLFMPKTTFMQLRLVSI